MNKMNTFRFLRWKRKYVPISIQHAWRFLLLLTFFFNWSFLVMAEDHKGKDHEIYVEDGSVSMSSPSVQFKILVNDDDDNQAYWTNAPVLYVNDKKVLALAELGFPTGKNHFTFTEKDTLVDNAYYVKISSRGEYNYKIHYDRYWAIVTVYIKDIDVDYQFTENDKIYKGYKVGFEGKWRTNNTGGVDYYVDYWTDVSVTDGLFNTNASRTLSRPKDKTVQYNQNQLKDYNGYQYEISFYENSDYTSRKCYYQLPEGSTSTGDNVRFIHANEEKFKGYLRQYLRNTSTGKTAVDFYKNFGKMESEGFISPTKLKVEAGSNWNKQLSLSWEPTHLGNSAKGKWCVFRMKDTYTSDRSVKTLVGTVGINASNLSTGYMFTDKTETLEYEQPYVYEVAFLPESWSQNDPEIGEGLSVHHDAVRVVIDNSLIRNFKVEEQTNSVILLWETDGFPSTDYDFVVWRRDARLKDSWVALSTIHVNNPSTTEYKYEDNTLTSACESYEYKVSLSAMDRIFESESLVGKLNQSTTITDVKASYGNYSDMVRVIWNANQIGTTPTKYVLSRRMLGGHESDWVSIYTVTGTDQTYVYEDMAVTPGQYYEYQVMAETPCEEGNLNSSFRTTDGFSLAKGVVSGRITYGTGTAVQGVKVSAFPASDVDYASESDQFYSLKVNSVSGGIWLPLDSVGARKLVDAHETTKGSFSVQMWVNFIEGNKPMVLDVYNNFSLLAKKEADGLYRMVMRVPDLYRKFIDYDTSILLEANKFHHLTFVCEEPTHTWHLYISHADSIQQHASCVATSSINLKNVNGKNSVTFGSNISKSEEYAFKGYIDEVRWWRKALTKEEILRNYGRLLTGTENGLAVYYPIDENIMNQRTAYDYSKTDDVANAMHGSINVGSTPSRMTPSSTQFGLYAYTDESGNYTLSGIPFQSGGTTYDIVPSLGTHQFSAEKHPRFISKNSLVHNAVNFTDVSSFKVEGVVYYENTRHPVEKCRLNIDGQPCVYEGRVVETDSEGRFTISVPIGNHYITIEKAGHTFLHGGRYPDDPDSLGTTVTFDREISGLTFTDMTKAVVVGRVSGGAHQASLPLGMGVGTANLGKAIITLQPESDSKMNVLMVENQLSSEVINNNKNIIYGNPMSGIVNSSAYVKGGDDNAVKTIVIETDGKNGEFVACLPPVAYKVVKVEIPEHSKGGDFFAGSLPRLDASSLIEKQDTLFSYNEDLQTNEVEGVASYHSTLVLNYRSQPQMEVTDAAHTDGAFGEVQASVGMLDGTKQQVNLYSVSETGDVEYMLGYPAYVTGNTYQMNLKAYEVYTNEDDKSNIVADSVALSGVEVHIDNAFSGKTVVEKADDMSETEGGDILQVDAQELVLDDNGRGVYTFVGGLPNIQGDHTLTLSLVYDVEGSTFNWSPNGEPFKAVVLGALLTGSNFVTEGPDQVLAVLRDPPGSNSYSTWAQGTIITTESQSTNEFIIDNAGFEATLKMGADITTAVGFPGAYTVSEMESDADVTVGLKGSATVSKGNIKRTQTTLTQAISTSDSPEFVGANGDVFVGNSTNMTFGKAREVGIYEVEPGVLELDLKEIMSVSEGFDTYFIYSQFYIENSLLPNLRMLRDALLLPPGTQVDVSNADKAYFISKVSSSHPNFGSNNSDECWGSEAAEPTAKSGPSYEYIAPTGVSTIDSVSFYNAQISLWQQHLANNEKAKADAIQNSGEYCLDKNISFDGGTVYENSYTNENGKGNVSAVHYQFLVNLGVKTGFTLNDLGVLVDATASIGGGETFTDEKVTTKQTTTSFVMADGQFTDAFSVDVFKSPNKDGLIFYTRGGQSSCPYEGVVKTKYYASGTIISQPTMQVEVPNLYCEEPQQTGVPAGEKAYFMLELQNNSEVNCDTWYNLSVVEDSNPHGAELLIDGLSPNRSFMIAAGQSVKKTLSISQGDPSVFDYEKIKIRLSAQCQDNPTAVYGEIADTIALSAYFVPTCSDIRLQVNNPVLNSNTSPILTLVVDAYNLNHENLQAIELLYQRQGDESWTQLKKYVTDKKYQMNGEDILEDAEVRYNFDMSHLPDYTYLFRAITHCGMGNTVVHNESEEVIVVKDLSKPALIGMPSPTDGIYDIGDEISIVFNEPIRGGSVDESNISVKGVLNDMKVAHQVAFKSNGQEGAATNVAINLSEQSFSVGLWMRYSKAGTIVYHGTADNHFSINVNENGQLEVNMNDSTYRSTHAVPTQKWVYLHVSLENRSGTSAMLQAAYASEDESVTLFSGIDVNHYYGQGGFRVGGTLVGEIHDISLWNKARKTEEAFANMYTSFMSYTAGLIGYWKMNEGEGEQANDCVRARHLSLPSSTAWYLNSENIALQLPVEGFAKIYTGDLSITSDDDCLLEFWLKTPAEEVTPKKYTLISLGDGALELSANAGELEMLCHDSVMPVYAANCLDGRWHHVALNVLNGTKGNTTLYIDGVPRRQFEAGELKIMPVDTIYLGVSCRQVTDSTMAYTYLQHGVAFDELRIWKGTHTAAVIRENRTKRVDYESVGLLAYYPLENHSLDAFGQPEVQADGTNQSAATPAHSIRVQALDGREFVATDWAEVDDVPALKSAPLMQNVPFSYVVSDRKLLIMPEASKTQMEGVTLNVSVKGVYDEHNNVINPITWNAYVSQNPLKWSVDVLSLRKSTGESTEFEVNLINKGMQTEYWVLHNLPSWLSVNHEVGTLVPGEEITLTFQASSDLSIGIHEVSLYVEGNEGVMAPLHLEMNVYGDEPDWSVNPGDYEHSMSLVGQLFINAQLRENPNDIVAAFIGTTCVGVARPIYVKHYDAYYVMMTIYGNDEMNNARLIFRAYDSETGKVHYSLLTKPRNEELGSGRTYVYFKTGTTSEGSFNNPLRLISTGEFEQMIPLNKGWTWTSFYVKPEYTAISEVMKSLGNQVDFVKDHLAFAERSDVMVENNAYVWEGELQSLQRGHMYKVRTQEALNWSVVGTELAKADPQRVVKGWNWLGYTEPSSLMLTDALASLNPQTGDYIKSQYEFAVYQDYEWVGTLKAMHPGQGYVYYSVDELEKELHYPATSDKVLSHSGHKMLSAITEDMTPMAENMNLIAVVKEGDRVVENAEIKVYVGAEVRAYSPQSINECHFLTVQGEGAGSILRFEVKVGDETYEVEQTLHFAGDALVGTLSEPYVLQLDDSNFFSAISLRREGNIFHLSALTDLTKVVVHNTEGRDLQMLVPQSTTATLSMEHFSAGVYLISVETVCGQRRTFSVVR